MVGLFFQKSDQVAIYFPDESEGSVRERAIHFSAWEYLIARGFRLG